MGFFGKKKDENVPQTPGAHYVNADVADSDLPVATPIVAQVVSGAPPAKSGSMPGGSTITTKTTIYPAPNAVQHGGGGTRASDPMMGGSPMDSGFRRAPVRLMACPSCGQPTRTKVRTWPNIFTWIFCVVLLLLFWPICWIPLVCDVFKQTDHYCTNCGVKVGEVTPMTDCCTKSRG